MPHYDVFQRTCFVIARRCCGVLMRTNCCWRHFTVHNLFSSTTRLHQMLSVVQIVCVLVESSVCTLRLIMTTTKSYSTGSTTSQHTHYTLSVELSSRHINHIFTTYYKTNAVRIQDSNENFWGDDRQIPCSFALPTLTRLEVGQILIWTAKPPASRF